jgi:hypothetical protein
MARRARVERLHAAGAAEDLAEPAALGVRLQAQRADQLVGSGMHGGLGDVWMMDDAG